VSRQRILNSGLIVSGFMGYQKAIKARGIIKYFFDNFGGELKSFFFIAASQIQKIATRINMTIFVVIIANPYLSVKAIFCKKAKRKYAETT